MDRYQLVRFALTRNPQSGDLLLMVDGATAYKAVFSRAFPNLYFSRTFEDQFGNYSWGTYIKGATEADKTQLEAFGYLLQSAVLIDDDLDECYALSLHSQTSASGSFERTPIGQVVYMAKPYNRPPNPSNREKADELAGLMANFIQQHPSYTRADCIVAVPPSNPNKPFDLPTHLAQTIGTLTRLPVEPTAIRKIRATRPMKDCKTVQEKIGNLKDAFQADPSTVANKTVILLDDIYQTGFSINEVGRTLRQAGAKLVFGLTATKTFQDLSEDG